MYGQCPDRLLPRLMQMPPVPHGHSQWEEDAEEELQALLDEQLDVMFEIAEPSFEYTSEEMEALKERHEELTWKIKMLEGKLEYHG